MRVLGLILSFSPYLRSTLGGWPLRICCLLAKYDEQNIIFYYKPKQKYIHIGVFVVMATLTWFYNQRRTITNIQGWIFNYSLSHSSPKAPYKQARASFRLHKIKYGTVSPWKLVCDLWYANTAPVPALALCYSGHYTTLSSSHFFLQSFVHRDLQQRWFTFRTMSMCFWFALIYPEPKKCPPTYLLQLIQTVDSQTSKLNKFVSPKTPLAYSKGVYPNHRCLLFLSLIMYYSFCHRLGNCVWYSKDYLLNWTAFQTL